MSDFKITSRAFAGDAYEETLQKARRARGGAYYKRIVMESGKLKYFSSKEEYEKWCEANGIEPHVDGARALKDRGSPTPVQHDTFRGSGAGSSGEKKMAAGSVNYNPALGKSEGLMDEFDQLLQKAETSADDLMKASKGGGWEPAPGSKKGGMRRRKAGGGYEYKYDMPEYKMSVRGGDRKQASEVAEQTKAGIEKSADICKVTPPVCAGNLGIPRKDMPQLEQSVVDNFLADLKKEGFKVEEGHTSVGQLKATQKEINAEKVKGMAKAHEEHVAKGGEGWSPSKNPIIISSDGYVLDGHHRWAAMLHIGPGEKMPTKRVSMPMKELLKRAKGYKGVTQAGFGDPSAAKAKKSMTTGEAFVYAKWCERLNKAVADAEERLGVSDPFTDLQKSVRPMVGKKRKKKKKKKLKGKMKGKQTVHRGRGIPQPGQRVDTGRVDAGRPGTPQKTFPQKPPRR